MGAFILIMTLTGGSSYSVNTSTVEFSNKQACLSAGYAWKKNAEALYGVRGASFLCAQK